MKYQICINRRYSNPALLKNWRGQAQAQATVLSKTNKRQAQATSEQKGEYENNRV